MRYATRFIAIAAILVPASGIFYSEIGAQTLYRSVGPDGKVIYSDVPPANARQTAPAGSAGAAAGNATAGLPFELRQVANRYPVVLYTTTNCAPCDSGRAMLAGRGIPFAEKTVTTLQDGAALKNRGIDGTLPLLTIGSQQLRGYSDQNWTQYLDAAGYPARSQLPASYRAPPASPLADPVPAAAQASAPASAPPPVALPEIAPANNPAGIRF